MKRQRWMFWAAMLAVSACGGNVDQSEDEAGGAAGTSNIAADGEAEEDVKISGNSPEAQASGDDILCRSDGIGGREGFGDGYHHRVHAFSGEPGT